MIKNQEAKKRCQEIADKSSYTVLNLEGKLIEIYYEEELIFSTYS